MRAVTCIKFDTPGRLVFQLAEVMVSRDMIDEMLEKTDRLRFNPGIARRVDKRNRDHIEAALGKVGDL